MFNINYTSHIKYQPATDGMYGASSERKDLKRTVIQGMKPRKSIDDAPNGSASPTENDRHEAIEIQQRPIAGILYSVSRDGLGEIFPLYVGRNTIGSEEKCDVYLSEDTVSPNHAVLLIRMLPDNTGKRIMSVSITDYDSDFGTAVNDRKVGFDSCALSGGEIIRIGNAYSFLFTPLDSGRHNLTPAMNFIPVPRVKARNETSPTSSPTSSFYAPAPQEEVYPTAVKEEDEFTFYGRTYAKKEDHSSNKTIL